MLQLGGVVRIFKGGNMRSIKAKILVAIIVCTVGAIMLSSFIISDKASQAIFDEAEERLNQQAQGVGLRVQEFVTGTELLVDNTVSTFGNSLELNKYQVEAGYRSSTNKNFKNILSDVVMSIDGTKEVFFLFNPELELDFHQMSMSNVDGEAVYNKNQLDMSLYNIEEGAEIDPSAQWYFDIKKHGNDLVGADLELTGLWSKPYMDADNQKLIAYYKPIYAYKKLIGVIGIRLDYTLFENEINSVQVYETGYAYLLDEKYNIMVHKLYDEGSDLRESNDDYNTIVDAMQASTAGVQEYTLDGEDSIVGFSRLRNKWTVVITPPLDEMLKARADMRNIMFIMMAVLSVVAAIIALILASALARPIKGITELLSKIGDLDLNEDDRLDKLMKSKDETGVMAKELDKVKSSLIEIVSSLKNLSGNLFEKSEDMVIVTNDSSESINHVNSSIEDLTLGANDQADEAQKSNEALLVLNEKIEKVIISVNKALEFSLQTKDVNEASSEVVTSLERITAETVENTNVMETNVAELLRTSNQIDEIVVVIKNIANQTNLLALNASIEAARAGEAGRGFAVVADEIRKLAVQTSDSTNQIEEFTIKIEDQVKVVSDNIALARNNADDTDKSTTNVSDAISNTIESVQGIIELIEDLTTELDDLSQSKDVVVNSIGNIAAVTEESSAAADSVSSMMENQIDNMNKISSSSESIGTVAEQIEVEMQKFRLDN